MKIKTAFILNYAPHYRLFLYKKISEELTADFYFGDIPNSSIKKLDYNKLRNFKKELKTLKFKNIYWYIGSLQVIFKPYQKIILTGDPQILSNLLILLLFFVSLSEYTFPYAPGTTTFLPFFLLGYEILKPIRNE